MFGNICSRGAATCPHHTHQDHVVIHDDCVALFANDMTHLRPKSVTFELLKRPSVIPGLHEALQAVAMRDCEVNLFLRYHWQLPSAGSSDEYITILTQSSAKCRVTAFSGCLSGLVLASLPATINQLWLAFTEDDDHMRNALSAMTENIARMEYLWLHVVAGTALNMLHPIACRSYGPHLVISGVSDNQVDWACDVARTLQPNNSWWEYWTLGLVRSTLSKDGCENLVKGLAERGVTVWNCNRGIQIASPALAQDDCHYLMTLAREQLNCSLSCGSRVLPELYPGRQSWSHFFSKDDEEDCESSEEEANH